MGFTLEFVWDEPHHHQMVPISNHHFRKYIRPIIRSEPLRTYSEDGTIKGAVARAVWLKCMLNKLIIGNIRPTFPETLFIWEVDRFPGWMA